MLIHVEAEPDHLCLGLSVPLKNIDLIVEALTLFRLLETFELKNILCGNRHPQWGFSPAQVGFIYCAISLKQAS